MAPLVGQAPCGMQHGKFRGCSQTMAVILANRPNCSARFPPRAAKSQATTNAAARLANLATGPMQKEAALRCVAGSASLLQSASRDGVAFSVFFLSYMLNQKALSPPTMPQCNPIANCQTYSNTTCACTGCNTFFNVVRTTCQVGAAFFLKGADMHAKGWCYLGTACAAAPVGCHESCA